MKRQQQSRRALGSDVLLTLVTADNVDTDRLFRDLWRQIEQFEATFSRFLPDSELTYVNQSAGERTAVTPAFAKLLRTAKRLSLATDGVYNPFVLPQLQAAGYAGSWPHPETVERGTDFRGRRMTAMSGLQIGEAWVKLPADTALDFGGIGKGYLLDQLADYLDAEAVVNYWLSLGGDITCSGHDIDGKPWRIGVQRADSTEIAGYITHVAHGRLAVATSGITKRRGSGWHHLIDPRSGLPATTDVLTATVSDGQASVADVVAKCVVIMGRSPAQMLLQKQRIHTALLQYQDSSGILKLQAHGDISLV